MRTWILVAALALALTTLPALAQHAHNKGEPYVIVTHDAPDDGRTFVGNVNTFGYVLFDKEGRPDFHHDSEVEVVLNGVTLYKTSPSAGHDYDGVSNFLITFPQPGRYEVRVSVPGDGEDVEATFSGYVLDLPGVAAELVQDFPTEAEVGTPIEATYSVHEGATGTIIDSDALIEVRRLADDFVVFRIKTHNHQQPQTLSYTFREPGDYEVRLLAYNGFPADNERVTEFMPILFTQTVAVADALPLAPVAGVPSRQPQENLVGEGDADAPYKVYTTYDPFTSIGPYGNIRLNVLVMNEDTGMPVAHTDFNATLTAPDGSVVFETTSIHEYDGILEVLASGSQIGDYGLSVDVHRGNWDGKGGWGGHADLLFSVVPPVVALGAGPQFTELRAPDDIASGTPIDLEFAVHDAAGVPFMHSELDFRIVDAAGVPYVASKLHTHDTGTFPLTVTFPSAGEWRVEVFPQGIEPTPTPVYYGPSPGAARVFTLSVAEGAPIPAVDPTEGLGMQGTADDGAFVPAAGALLVGLALAAAVLVSRRW